MNLFRVGMALVAAACGVVGSAIAQTGTALVQQAPTINGTVEGSVRQLTAQSVTLNGGASITGDLLIPGTPEVRLNGQPTYGGTLDVTCAATPTNHQVTLNGQAALRHVIRRTDGTTLPTVSPPPLSSGTRTVTLNNPGDSPGDFATLKDLTLASGFGALALPAGTYGNFTAHSGSGFILGTTGGTTPLVYHFQSLTLNSNSSFQVVGPVIVTLPGNLAANTTLGAAARPDWLQLRLASGGLTVNGNRIVHAHLTAPSGPLTLNGTGQFIGAVAVDRLTVNGNALLRLVVPPSSNQPPAVALTFPADGASFAAPGAFTLAATASDPDGTVTKVEFFSGPTKLGEDAAAPYEQAITGLSAGSHAFTARATDNLGATTDSTAITVNVTQANQPPTVTLTSPADGSLHTAPATIALAATAADSDGTIAKVEFYQGATKLAEDLTAPYEFSTTPLLQGTYSFTARAIDNLGAATSAAPATVTVIAANQSPTVSLTGPADGATFTAPAAFSLAALAADTDGTVTRVEFFQNAVLLGQDTSAPYTFAVIGLPSGSYHYLARATDNLGSATDSAPVHVTVTGPVRLGLPFLAGFEPAEGYVLGALQGQQGWTASSSAVVTGADFASGTQSALIPDATPVLTLARAFDPHPGQPVVFLDLFSLLQAGSTASDSALFETLNATRIALVREGTAGRFAVFAGDGSGGGLWNPTRGTVAVDTDGFTTDWTRLTVRADFGAKKWDLYVGGVMAAADVGFLQNAATNLGGFTFTGRPEATGPAEAPTLLDDFLAGFENPLFADADRDGMADAWESAHGLNPALNDRNGDPDADGLTNVREYLLGTNPNSADSDGDGLPDGWEHQYGLSPTENDAVADLDGDSVSNLTEFLQGRNPTKGAVPDTAGAVSLRVYQPTGL